MIKNRPYTHTTAPQRFLDETVKLVKINIGKQLTRQIADWKPLRFSGLMTS
jgi:hypothetical protein